MLLIVTSEFFFDVYEIQKRRLTFLRFFCFVAYVFSSFLAFRPNVRPIRLQISHVP